MDRKSRDCREELKLDKVYEALSDHVILECLTKYRCLIGRADGSSEFRTELIYSSYMPSIGTLILNGDGPFVGFTISSVDSVSEAINWIARNGIDYAEEKALRFMVDRMFVEDWDPEIALDDAIWYRDIALDEQDLDMVEGWNEIISEIESGCGVLDSDEMVYNLTESSEYRIGHCTSSRVITGYALVEKAGELLRGL